jgi:hypothetical protein
MPANAEAERRRLGAMSAGLLRQRHREIGGDVQFLRPVLEAVAAGRELDRRWSPGGPWT